MRAKSDTVVVDGNTIEVRYEQPQGQVSITIALLSGPPVDGTLYERLLAAAQAWVMRLRFDLYVCRDELYADGKAITLELDCPEKQDAVIRKLPYLVENIRTQAAQITVELNEPQPSPA